ncbi:hypothetical protein [Streptomyces cacaoi]|uniref:hypothetical protein n=1 Tax=Streptomyces cacaoi TaxID=1898 RepID=UPI0033340771
MHHEDADDVVLQWVSAPNHSAEVEGRSREKWEEKGLGAAQAIRDKMPDRWIVHHVHAVYLPGRERLNTNCDGQRSVLAWEFEPDLYADLSVRWHDPPSRPGGRGTSSRY